MKKKLIWGLVIAAALVGGYMWYRSEQIKKKAAELLDSPTKRKEIEAAAKASGRTVDQVAKKVAGKMI